MLLIFGVKSLNDHDEIYEYKYCIKTVLFEWLIYPAINAPLAIYNGWQDKWYIGTNRY